MLCNKVVHRYALIPNLPHLVLYIFPIPIPIPLYTHLFPKKEEEKIIKHEPWLWFAKERESNGKGVLVTYFHRISR
jgi:hypothetical protein